MLSNKINEFFEFDDLTQFRIINAFLFSVGFNLILPVLMDLKGELLTSTFITFIMIMSTLSVKLNKYFIRLSKEMLYRIGIFVHVVFVLGALLYFVNPLYFVYVDSALSIIEVAVFSSYSIKLDQYLSNHYPLMVSKFQVYRNSIYADGTLLGLFVVYILSFWGNDYSVNVFITYNSLFIVWMLINWNKIENAVQSNKLKSGTKY